MLGDRPYQHQRKTVNRRADPRAHTCRRQSRRASPGAQPTASVASTIVGASLGREGASDTGTGAVTKRPAVLRAPTRVLIARARRRAARAGAQSPHRNAATDADRALARPRLSGHADRITRTRHGIPVSDPVGDCPRKRGLAAALIHEHTQAFRTFKRSAAADEGDASDSGNSVAEPPWNGRKLRQPA